MKTWQRLLFVVVFVVMAVVAITPGYAQDKGPGGAIEPQGWWAYNNPYKWEYPFEGGRWHVLGVWSGSNGYGQEYTGPGGYDDTCSSNHGCIDNWTWWSLNPESKLGIPFTWFWDPGKPERRIGSNYWAWNYVS